jgi:S1-C subfamily serine protease
MADQDATTGQPAVVAGFPHSGPFRLTPVRVRSKVSTRTDDIYGQPGGTRAVYVVRGEVQKGESGGPMLNSAGEVLGMVFGADPDQNSNGYVIANDDLYEAIAKSTGVTEPTDTGSCNIRQ